MTTSSLLTALRAGAQGIYVLEAAAGLIIERHLAGPPRFRGANLTVTGVTAQGKTCERPAP